MIRRILALFGTAPESPIHTVRGFVQLDPKHEAKRLNLAHMARKDGVRDQPPPDADRLGPVEREIAELGQRTLHDNRRRYDEEYREYTRQLDLLTPDGMLGEVQSMTARHLADLTAFAHKYQAPLQDRATSSADATRKLRLFAHDNGLEERDAVYPKSKLLHFSILVGIVFIESFLNATFLAKGSELGLLGGWTEAITFSIVNGVLAWFLSLALRHAQSIKPWTRLGAWLGILAFAISVFCFNLLIAHYRDALGGENPEQAQTIAMSTLLSSPFHIKDIQSIMLLALGVVCVILSALDWFTMDDPYPGYGAATRRAVEAKGELHRFHDWLVNVQLEQIRSDASDIITNHSSQAASAASNAGLIVTHIKNLNDRYRASIEAVVENTNHLLQTYRDANAATRKTAAPKTFKERWGDGVDKSVNSVPVLPPAPNPDVYEQKLRPLQQDVAKRYQTALKTINEQLQ
jgi:hypothetical protein